MWPRRRPDPVRVTLCPVTVGRHLAVRAAAGVGYVEGEGGDGPPPEFAAMPSADLLAVLDAALVDPPARMRDRPALVALAAAVWDAWTEAAEEATQTGLARARLVVLHTGQGMGGEGDTEAPPPEMLAAQMTLPEWAAVREMPLWEAVMQRAASASLERFQKALSLN